MCATYRAMDGADSSGGSFDAQGAFHGGHNFSDDEEVGTDPPLLPASC